MTETNSAPDRLLEDQIEARRIGTRTNTAAMLAWFLQNVWRIEPEEIDSAICDSGGDLGVDALIFDEDDSELTILHGVYSGTPEDVRQPSNEIKLLIDAVKYFESPETVDSLLASNPNKELKALIERQEVKKRLAASDYTIRTVFVTNTRLDDAATEYASQQAGESPQLAVWHRDRLVEAAHRTRRPDLRSEPVKLTLNSPPIVASLSASESIAIGMVPASCTDHGR